LSLALNDRLRKIASGSLRASASTALANQLDAHYVRRSKANRLGENDASQLQWAAQEGRVFLTFNVGHFARLHHEWLGGSRHHAGIVVSRQRPIGDLLRRVLALATALNAGDMRDRLEYLSRWSSRS